MTVAVPFMVAEPFTPASSSMLTRIRGGGAGGGEGGGGEGDSDGGGGDGDRTAFTKSPEDAASVSPGRTVIGNP